MSVDVIILMFGFGMVVHLLISMTEEKFFFKKELDKARTNGESSQMKRVQ